MESTIESPANTALNSESDKLPIASLFTPENAREMAKRSWEVRRQRKAAEELAPPIKPLDSHLNPLQAIIADQIRDIDDRMERANDRSLASLADAKTKLWKLLFPAPKATRGKRSYDRAEPIG